MIIQILLIAATLAFGVFLLREHAPGSRAALRRLVGIAIVLTGIVAVLFPNATNWVAHRVGVGRGADLLLYAMVMIFMFTTAATYQNMRRLERRLTRLTRELALLTPRRNQLDTKL